MNYQKKYENIISRIESLLDAWHLFEPSMKDSRKAFANKLKDETSKQFFQNILKGEQDLIKFLNELVQDNNDIEQMPSGVEVVKGETFIYACDEFEEGKMLGLAKANLKQLLQNEELIK